MKPLMPSLRENNRYVKFHITAKKALNEKELEKILQEEFLTFLGQLEFAKSPFKLIKLNGNKGLIKVNAKYLEKAKAMLTMIQKINNEQVDLKSLKTSGLLNKLKED
jgi:RNase P/RNase MRP subunit POP5